MPARQAKNLRPAAFSRIRAGWSGLRGNRLRGGTGRMTEPIVQEHPAGQDHTEEESCGGHPEAEIVFRDAEDHRQFHR